MKRFNGFLAAIGVIGISAASNAAVLNQQYVAVQIANDPNFQTGLTTVTLTGSNPSLTLLAGQYFRFGVAVGVTGNSNPASGSSWDLSNQNFNGGPPQPANLGLAVIGLHFDTSDGTASVIAPQITSGTSPSRSTAVVAPGTPNPSFDVSDKGDVSGGNVGDVIRLGGGYLPPADPSTDPSKLAAFTSMGNLFTRLSYAAVTPGTTTLAESVDPSALNFWQNVSPGTTSNGTASGTPVTSASYASRPYDAATDTIGALPAITITVNPAPEPSSAAALLIASTAGLLVRRRRSAN